MTGIEVNSEWHRIKNAHKRLIRLANDLEEGWDWLYECDDSMMGYAGELKRISDILRSIYPHLTAIIEGIESEWESGTNDS